MNYENMLTLKGRMGEYHAGCLLDVAVGRGDFLRFALDSFRSWQSAAGIDSDADALATAKNEFEGTPVILVLGSALTMPFTSHYFDTVTMSNALHHIDGLPSLFTEVSRVCKGIIFINEMINECNSQIQETYMTYHRFIAEVDKQLGRYHREPFTVKELLSLMRSSGLQTVDHFVHAEIAGDPMNPADIEAMSDRLKNKVALLKGTDYYYFYENKAREIISRFNKNGIYRPRHITFVLKST